MLYYNQYSEEQVKELIKEKHGDTITLVSWTGRVGEIGTFNDKDFGEFQIKVCKVINGNSKHPKRRSKNPDRKVGRKGIKIKQKRYRDWTGQRQGKLLVVGYVGVSDTCRGVLWECVCDCGVKKVIKSGYLSNGVQSCGCLKKENLNEFTKRKLLPDKGGCVNRLLRRYKIGASSRNLEFSLTLQEFVELINMDCSYCGTSATSEVRTTRVRKEQNVLKYTGIDRIDSEKGYYKENCVPCCGKCNFAKYDMTKHDFLKHIEKIYNFNFG